MGKIHRFFLGPSDQDHTMFESLCISKEALRTFRIFSFIVMVAVIVSSSQDGFDHNFKFLTYWGILFVLFYFTVITLCYFIHRKEDPTKRITPHPFWKVPIILFELAWTYQVLIVPIFWLVGYPETPQAHVYPLFEITIGEHAVTGLLIYLEMGFNKILFFKRHSLFCFMVSMLYIYNNYYFTKLLQMPVYLPITWKDRSSIYLCMLGVVVIMIIFFIGVLISKAKFLKKKKETKSNEEIILKSMSMNL